MGDGRGTGQGQPGDHREDGGEGHGGEEAEEQVAAHRFGQVHGDHVAAADQGAARFAVDEVLRVGADYHDGGEAEHADHQEEEADESRGVEHRFARLPGIGHGEEAHQDVRQAGQAEHQAEGH
ncbi:hypothetical protein D3C81_1796220 [compost metagenome]